MIRTFLVFAAAALAVFLLMSLGGADSPVPDDVLAQLLMLEDQRHADMLVIEPLLSHDNPNIRARACLALGRIGSLDIEDPFRPRLEAMLTDGDARVRSMAAFALGEIADVEAAAALTVALDEDPEWRVRAGAVEALAKIGALEALPRIAEAIGSDANLEVRRRALLTSHVFNAEETAQAARKVLADGPGELVPAAAYHFTRNDHAVRMKWEPELLTQLAADQNPEVRKAAAALASRLRSRSTAVVLLNTLLKDSNMNVRIVALGAAARAGFIELLPVMREQSLEAPVHERQQLAAALGAMGRILLQNDLVERPEFAEVQELLSRLAADDRQAVAADAMRSIATLGSTGLAMIDPEEISTDDRHRVRAMAVHVAFLLPEEQRDALLQQLISDEHPFVRSYSATVIADQETQPVEPLIRQFLDSDDQVLAAIAAGFYGGNRSSQAAPALVNAYKRFEKEPDAEAMGAIIGALGTYAEDNPAIHELLVEALETSPDYLVRRAAARALAPIDGKSVYSMVGTVNTGRDPDWYRQALQETQNYAGMLVNTSSGTIALTFHRRMAPLTVHSFIRLAQQDFFEDTIIHRVVPNFVAQMGDPRGDGWGGPGYALRCEISPLRFHTGSVGMAHAGKDTGGCQFFITYLPTHHLDGGYTIFASVTDGMDVADRLSNGSRLNSIELVGRAGK